MMNSMLCSKFSKRVTHIFQNVVYSSIFNENYELICQIIFTFSLRGFSFKIPYLQRKRGREKHIHTIHQNGFEIHYLLHKGASTNLKIILFSIYQVVVGL